MNCHGDNKEKNGSHKHSPIKHMLHMVICCGLPIVLLASLPLISKVSPGAARLVSIIAPFLCPLMMIGMIPMMMGGNRKESHTDNKIEKIGDKPLELNEHIE